MKRAVGSFGAMLVAGATSVSAAPPEPERAGIERAVRCYFAGVDARDVETMKEAFHPDARMLSVKDGALVEVTMPEWWERIRGSGPGPQAVARSIVAVDIAGTAASVRAESEYPTFRFIDYLSLLKVHGEWRIVGKIFHRQEK